MTLAWPRHHLQSTPGPWRVRGAQPKFEVLSSWRSGDGARFPDQLHKMDAGAALSHLGVSREFLERLDPVGTDWKMKPKQQALISPLQATSISHFSFFFFFVFSCSSPCSSQRGTIMLSGHGAGYEARLSDAKAPGQVSSSG